MVTVKEATVGPPTEEIIPLDVRVCMEERAEGRMKPEQIALELPSVSLSSWEMQ